MSKSSAIPAGMGVPGIGAPEVKVPGPVTFPEESVIVIPIMVIGTGSEPPVGIDHPKDEYAHTPTASRVEHCGCAARVQQRQRTSTAALVRFRVYILITTPVVSGGRREAPPAAGSLLMEPVWQPAASPPFVIRN